MRVALLAHLHHPIAEPFAGGMEMHTSMVADELVLRGHDVTLFAKQHSTTLAQLEPVIGDDFVYGPARHSDSRDRLLDQAAARALRVIQRGDFDLVFNNSLNPLPYTRFGAWPMVTVLHTPPTLEKVNAVIERPGWRPAPNHRFVSVSRSNAASWRSKLPQVQCIPNGIYLDHWVPGFQPQPDLAAWSARITPEKGLHLAIDAARAAGLRLEFGGPIGDPAYFDAEIAPRLGPDTVYHGHLGHPELAELLGRAAVFLSTPLWAEPFGLSLVEAMACGTPVAALPNGAAREVVSTAGGVVAREVSVASLAVAIARALTKDRGRVRRHAERFDARSMITGYENLMHSLSATPPAALRNGLART